MDTSVLQTLFEYAFYIYEGEPLDARSRLLKRRDAYEELDALRAIFSIADRGEFGFAISTNTLREVAARAVPSFDAFAFDVLDHWEVIDMESPSRANQTLLAKIDGPTFGYLSDGDKRLVRDALEYECDGFLTMERRLPRNADDILNRLQLNIMRPSQFWKLLKPFAALFK